MSFDPSVIGDIGKDNDTQAGFRGLQQGLTLKSMIDQRQLREMDMRERQKEQDQLGNVQSILKRSDLSTFEGQTKAAQEALKINPKMGMELQRGFQQNQAGENHNTMQQYQLLGAKHDAIWTAVAPLAQQAEQLKSQGKNEAEINAALMPKAIQSLQQLQGAKLPNGQPVLDQQDMQGVQQMFQSGKIQEGLAQVAATSQKAQAFVKQKLSERQQTERERHDKAMENQSQQRVDVSKEKLERSATGSLTSKALDEIADQALTGDSSGLVGLSKADKAAARNRIADVMEIQGKTGADLAAKNAEFFGIKAGERALGTRQANIDTAANEAEKLIPIALEASEKVPRGAFVPWNKLFQIAERGSSNKELLAFAQAARSLANVYTRAVVPGASGVADREESIASLPIYTDQASFKAVTDIMRKEIQAAKESPEAVRKHLGDDIAGRPHEQTPPPPAAAPQAAAEPTATGPNGEKIVFRGGQWVPMNGK